ncbi:MAG: phosphomethylpyrimidine synthase ThiC, partial [Thiohalospira sp.]
MSIPKTTAESVVDATRQLSEDVTRPLPGSRKVWVTGSRPDIRVGMREVEQSPTQTSSGLQPNPPLPVYDTSGPYTDPEAAIDLTRGLAGLREAWIAERGDTEELPDLTSEYGRARRDDPALADLRFDHLRTPRRAK